LLQSLRPSFLPCLPSFPSSFPSCPPSCLPSLPSFSSFLFSLPSFSHGNALACNRQGLQNLKNDTAVIASASWHPYHTSVPTRTPHIHACNYIYIYIYILYMCVCMRVYYTYMH
jgi:hypothetical protein